MHFARTRLMHDTETHKNTSNINTATIYCSDEHIQTRCRDDSTKWNSRPHYNTYEIAKMRQLIYY